jgi:rhomboid protease GluP
MGRLDALLARPGAVPVTAALGVVCVLVFGLQIVSPSSYDAGFFSAMLVGLGEPWRLVTANFLHASPGHLALNGVGLVVLGTLAERSLGSRALGPVVALAGLGAMAASYAAGYQRALGASGLVTGLAGALLWLEFRAPEALPATWRIPRRLFVGLIALETLGLLALPGIAHAAHAGGLAAGALAAAAVGPRLRDAGGPRPGLAVLNALALAATLLAGISFARAVYAPDADAIARRGEGLLALADVPVDFLNNEAWRIAVSKHPRPEALDVARRMAERAAAETGWAAPAILDTLAEIHFLSGRPELAREIEGAAVALAPDEPYYREQLRRFGEPPEGERPDAPGGGGPEPRRPEPRRSPPAEPGPGVRV